MIKFIYQLTHLGVNKKTGKIKIMFMKPKKMYADDVHQAKLFIKKKHARRDFRVQSPNGHVIFCGGE
jgi:phage antirepressor YoqD-like protein